MSLTSGGFLLFILLLLICYYLVPKKVQWIVLLASSLIFYCFAGISNSIFVLVTATSVYFAARHMEKLAESDNTCGDLFADAQQMAFDITGRIIITPELIKHAGIKNNAIFVGRGNSFQIWNPDNFRKSSKFQPIIQKK